MDFWTAAVIIVAIGAVAGVLQARYRALHGITKDEDGNETRLPLTDENTQRELTELRERVKVLERITTDDHKPKALSAEIEKLRDQ